MLQLSQWDWEKMAGIFQTTFSSAFSWMKMCEFRLSFHWNLFLRFEFTIFQHWFRKWDRAVQAANHYLDYLDYRCLYASLTLNELTWQRMIFSTACSWEKIYIYIRKIPWYLFLRVELTNKQALVDKIICIDMSFKPNRCCDMLTCVILNSLRPSDAYMRQ